MRPEPGGESSKTDLPFAWFFGPGRDAPFWTLVGGFRRFSSGFKRRNTVIYGVFVRLAWQKYVLQHAENCVNTVVFGSRSKKHRKYRGFGLARRQKNTVFTEFFAPRMFKKHENTTYLTIFRLYLVGGS